MLGIIAGGTLLGVIIGSFTATLVIRWPLDRSIVSGRSHCDSCELPLSATELIPLLSFVFQRGRCRGCRAAINPRHFFVELACGFIGGAAFAISPDVAGLAGAVFGWVLVALIMLDAEHFWLPDKLVLPLGAAGLLFGVAGIGISLNDRMFGALAGYLSLELIRITYRLTRGREGLGGGDPKLLGAIGAWLGWQVLPFVVLGASAVGLLWVLTKMTRGQVVSANDRIPLGSLLALAAIAVWPFTT